MNLSAPAAALSLFTAGCALSTARGLSAAGYEYANGSGAVESWRGREALRLDPLPGHEQGDGSMIATLPGPPFHDGTIEVDVAGSPRPGAPAGSKGFIGVLFRANGEEGELIYLRPSNARSQNQLERNHSVQYVSPPAYGWKRLRQETPGLYESYVDLEPGAWTHMRIEVAGTQARLFVGDVAQPCLVVDGLKHGDSAGAVALWAHETTLAFFANPVVTAKK